MEGRKILICCDGTCNDFEDDTNVVRLHSQAEKDKEPLPHYDKGVGTGNILKAVTGVDLQKNVEKAYRYLMKNYQEGDQLYLIGFSRGAFTVRALAGMLCKVGLLHADLDHKLPRAIKNYKASKNDKVANDFKEEFSRPCIAHFIGVWDTVKALTFPAPGMHFHDNILHPDIKYGYHAISIDEKRYKYRPYVWDEKTPRNGQTIEQVWFPGVHADVGGGYDERGLANGALYWLACKAAAHGLSLDLDKIKHAYPADPLGKIHESHKGFFGLFLEKRKRPILSGAKVHHSAIKRMNNPASNYNPTNLPEKYTEVTDDCTEVTDD